MYRVVVCTFGNHLATTKLSQKVHLYCNYLITIDTIGYNIMNIDNSNVD